MLVTTTPNIEGHHITDYYGLVSGEAILGANIFKDLFAGIRDIVGGRSAAYAVIAVDLDYESIGGGGGNMLMVTASGTAVRFEE